MEHGSEKAMTAKKSRFKIETKTTANILGKTLGIQATRIGQFLIIQTGNSPIDRGIRCPLRDDELDELIEMLIAYREIVQES